MKNNEYKDKIEALKFRLLFEFCVYHPGKALDLFIIVFPGIKQNN